MHGKGSLAALLLVAALAVPPAMYFRVWDPPAHADSQGSYVPPPTLRSALHAPPEKPQPVKATAPDVEVPEILVMDRDPMLSPADIEALNRVPPPEPEPAPAEAPRPPRPRPQRLDVHGIIAIDGQERKAIINGRETAVGEKVGKSRVVGIDLDGVRFRSKGKTFKKKVGD